MNKFFFSLVIAGSMAMSLSAFANKGATYQEKSDDFDWSKNWYLGLGMNGNAESAMTLNGSPETFEHFAGFDGLDEVEQTGSSPGFEFYFGRRFNRHWSIELGYTLLGDMHFQGEIAEVRTEKIELTQQNVHLVTIGKLPVSQYFNFFIRGGAAYFKTMQEVTSPSTDITLRDKDSTLALTYGAGIDAELEHWGLRGDYNVIWPTNSALDDFYIADIISASIYYKFD